METQAVSEAGKFLGETWGFWVQTGALFISALAAIALIYANGQDQKRRATIDLVLHQKQDRELQAALRHVLDLREKRVTNFAKYLEDRNSEDFKNIVRVLNNYEFIAAGIQEGAFDQELFKRMQYSVVLKNWDALHGFVTEFRRQNDIQTLFQEFQRLAQRWESSPLKKYNP